jgi:hypothetical protein
MWTQALERDGKFYHADNTGFSEQQVSSREHDCYNSLTPTIAGP